MTSSSPRITIMIFATDHTKQVPQWNLQIMQAILLCEYFARFRGRKAVVRPSKLFENLYSRVSGSESLVSSFSDGDHVPPFPVSLSESSSSSRPSSLSSSSAGFCTSSIPAWSPQASVSPPASSTSQGLYQYDNIHQDSNPFLFSPVLSFSPSQASTPDDSLIYDHHIQAYNNVSIDNAFLSFSSDNQGQSYSDSFSSQVLDYTPVLYESTMPADTADFGSHQNMGISTAFEQRWHSWLEAEGHRRLLAACFIVDNHASVFHQQPRARGDVHPSTIPLTAYTDALWNVGSAHEWAALLEENPAIGRPQCLPRLDTLTPEEVAQYTVFDQASILNAAALSLPRRHAPRSTTDQGDGQDEPDDLRTPTTASYAPAIKADERLVHLFSHCVPGSTADVYAALHHTPLHDLLAVSGDSWVFSQKIIGAPTFLEHQKRLKAWVEGRGSASSPTQQHHGSGSPVSPTTAGLEGMSAPKATIHAARALLGYLEREEDDAACISNYWAVYACALIIWAFGHRAGKSSSSGSGGGSSGSPTTTTTRGPGQMMGEEEAVNWLRIVAQNGQQPEHVARVRGRREASAAVVSLVRRRLEADCVGGRSWLYVDAVGVLKKLEEGTNTRRF